MQIILVRHALAGERDPEKYPDDDLRPITGAGRRTQAAAAKAMQARGIRFDHLVTSPLLRAVQTAEIVADVYEFDDQPQVSEVLGHGFSPGKVVQLVSKFGSAERVALVGHEPDLGTLAAALTGSTEPLKLKKSGVVGIGFEGKAELGEGTLLYHLEPGKRGLRAARR